MSFDDQYLTYTEYGELGGQALTETSFNLLEYRARKEIDKRTKNRFQLIEPEDYPQELKLCVYELLDSVNDENNSNISSETIGSYSVTKLSKVELEKKKDDIISRNLSEIKVNGVYVLYLGEDIDY